METKDEQNLIQGFDKDQRLDEDLDTKSCSTGKIIIIVVAIILVLAVIGVVLYFTVFKKSSSNSDDSYTTTIDTFTQEEMDKARNALNNFHTRILPIAVTF